MVVWHPHLICGRSSPPSAAITRNEFSGPSEDHLHRTDNSYLVKKSHHFGLPILPNKECTSQLEFYT
jgi:hypothetical protein